MTRINDMPDYVGIDPGRHTKQCPKCGGRVEWWYVGEEPQSDGKKTVLMGPECKGSCPPGADTGLPVVRHPDKTPGWTPRTGDG
ncbi:hypothetical protein MPRS_54780 [Mycobacterium paraseoulense]|nr:hypothetical protein MPRS_54780 [Mycobacterium paraseoulense]